MVTILYHSILARQATALLEVATSSWRFLHPNPRFLVGMDKSKKNAEFSSCDAYFEAIQSKKKLPLSLQQTLTAAFAQIPVSSFP